MAFKEFSSTQPLFGCPSPVGTGTVPVLVAEGLIEELVCLESALHDSMATGCWCGWGAQICRALSYLWMWMVEMVWVPSQAEGWVGMGCTDLQSPHSYLWM